MAEGRAANCTTSAQAPTTWQGPGGMDCQNPPAHARSITFSRLVMFKANAGVLARSSSGLRYLQTEESRQAGRRRPGTRLPVQCSSMPQPAAGAAQTPTQPQNPKPGCYAGLACCNRLQWMMLSIFIAWLVTNLSNEAKQHQESHTTQPQQPVCRRARPAVALKCL